MLILPRGGEAPEVRSGRKDRLTVERWASDRGTAMLVRPDGYVAWAADGTDAGAVEAAVAEHVG